MLIVIEGLDGSGKSTQVRKVLSYLKSKDDDVSYIHFPRYDSKLYGELISRFLRGDFGSKDAVHPQLVALLFAEDRHDAVPDIRRVLDREGTVLSDRYVYSNIAYQCAKLKDSEECDKLRKWIIDTEYEEFGLPEPDINIFLDVPIGFVKHNLKKNREGRDRLYLSGQKDIHEESIEYQEKVREMYLKLVEEDSNFVRIDCSDAFGNMSAENVIFEKIKIIIDSIIK